MPIQRRWGPRDSVFVVKSWAEAEELRASLTRESDRWSWTEYGYTIKGPDGIVTIIVQEKEE